MNVPISFMPLELADPTICCSCGVYIVEHAAPKPTFPTPHSHDCYEFYINFSGDVSFLVNDKLYAVQSGDLIIARPGEMHVSIIQSPCSYKSYCFYIRKTALTAFADRPDMHHHIRFRESDRARLMEIIQRLHQAESAGNEIERTAWVYHLLGMLNGAPEPELVSVSAPLPEKLQKILTYINRSFPELHSIDEIAGHFYISSATLTRWFREYLQMTPKNYLEARRLAYSKDLLIRGVSVTEVSTTAGFSSCSRFICVFRQKFGVTPLQYQKGLHAAPLRSTHTSIL